MLLLRYDDFIDGIELMIQWLRKVRGGVRRHIKCVKLLGTTGIGIVVWTWLGSHREVKVRIQDLDMWVRLNSTDLATLLQIFWAHDYEFDIAVPPNVIIDGGANVGYATMYFAARYPQARIIAVEPHPENFAQLQKNTQGHSRITAVQAALWHKDEVLGLWDPDEGHWGFRVTPESTDAAQVQINGINIATLINQFGIDYIDILKLDVEGSEKEIFEHSSSWINDVGVIVAELHDKYRVGCARAFYNATQTFPHEERLGENILMMREGYIRPSSD